MKYDVAIIGAGLSGLGAGVRLTHYDKKVCILERHSRVGGLNSYFSRNGREFDVGLHAMTNFAAPTNKRAPLNKLLRQLRLPREALALCEHRESAVRFDDCQLRFNNDFELLHDEVAAKFPGQLDGFERLVAMVKEFTPGTTGDGQTTIRPVLNELINDPLLQNMLLCPLMYYGNPRRDDMALDQFCIMFQSIFLEGFCKPRRGIRALLDILTTKFRENGGDLLLRKPVSKLTETNGRISNIQTTDGDEIIADQVLSCAGYPETMALIHPPQANATDTAGEMAFMETIFVLEKHTDLALPESAIVFYNDRRQFEFAPPQELTDHHSATVCFPDNFPGIETASDETSVRITRIASPTKWFELNDEDYRQAKKNEIHRQLELMESFVPGAAGRVVLTDSFTPRTIHRYTHRINGAIYGSPLKHPEGDTPFPNLFICGTDQGFLGITGSILSGISIANRHLLR